jgi:amino acid adenylation domain-containing protein/thioester reductase-like protein
MNKKEQTTLVHILEHRANVTPNKVAYIFLEDGEKKENRITYAELDQQARCLAATLQQQHKNIHQQRVLLIYPQGLEFIIAFFGALYAGATAVLVYPPTSLKMAKRLNGIVKDCSIAMILSTTKVIVRMKRMNIIGDEMKHANDQINIASHDWINTDEIDSELTDNFIEQEVLADDIAFLQYTSGSTGTPKGVMVSHGNLMANQHSIQTIYKHTKESVNVGWLPLIHDMGLIGNVLQPMYVGFPLVFMSPLHFVQKPVRWLRAIDRYRATTAGGPNFAYDLCVRKISREEVADLDLSCWDIAFNGAEPVRKETVIRFSQAFAHCGLRPESQMAVYGLAEATLIVSGTEKDSVLATDGESDYMSSGQTIAGDTVKIVNVETHEVVAENEEGEIWVNSPSNAVGYWNRDVETKETFKAQIKGDDKHYMRSGDTGFLVDGQLHVTGRIKDVIIVQGKNYHAEDVEWTLNDIEGVRQGCCAAFSLVSEQAEELVIVAGATIKDEQELAKIVTEIRAAVYQDYQLQIDRVVLIKAKELPMTTSGKVQRRLSNEMYSANEFTVLYEQSLKQHTSGTHDENTDFLAASTSAECELTQVWGEILGLPAEEIGINDNFFECGGSSLTMLELANRLNVTMELLFRYPTIGSYLYRTSEYEFPNVEKDIYLPPAAIDKSLIGNTGISLITGGTGFFGLHFLQSVMKRTSDKFVLLVRGKDQAAIQKKLNAAVAQFQMEADIDLSRIILIRGDLSEKHVGIPDEDYSWVCTNVDKIYHIGSHVNNWLPYEGIREINVDGTRSLIQLARTGRKKEFHYTSTSTFAPDKADPAVFLEGDNIDRNDINKYFGYDISKYASETMCKMARAEGLVSNIYRLVWVGGHIGTGLTKVNDGFNIMLRMLITLQVFPKGNYLHDIVPVDLMADSMASLQGKCENVDFNITSQSKESIDLKRLVVMLRDMGYKIDEVSRTEFVERLKNYPIEQWDEYCRSYRQLVIRLFEDVTPKKESFYDGSNFLEYMDKDVLAKMEEKFIDDWFGKTVNFLVQNNALPTASGNTYSDEMTNIATWNESGQAAKPLSFESCLHQLFEAQSDKTPNAIAISFADQKISYQQLNRQSNEIAQTLKTTGVQQGALVGLCVDRSPTMIATILAIFKVGCAYVPLDPSYPIDSLGFIINDSDVQYIVADVSSSSALVHYQEKLLVVDEDILKAEYQEWTDADFTNQSHIDVKPTELAYVIYTSGTTGNPKGVLVEHASVVNHTLAMIEHFTLTPEDNLLQFSTVNFDSFIEEVFPTLFAGATLVLTEQSTLTDVEKLSTLITQQQVNILKLSTAYWHTISQLSVEALGVRLAAIGGEEADITKYNTWRENNPNIPLVNTYGPTETTVTVSTATFYGQQEKLTIGKPIANTQLHVLNSKLKQVPIGFVGELYIAGKGVSRGYLNNAELTEETFIDNPFAAHEKMYKSGDLVRWLDDGNIEFIGRVDNQVKVRGYRIELSAIESILSEHAKVSQAAVVIKQIDTMKKIVAYIQASYKGVLVEELRSHLEQRLPSYMLPNMIIELDAIPVNPNGKVDRKVLTEMDISVVGNLDFSTANTVEELTMVSIWENLLGVNGIGLNDNFMELGGHSLLIMSLINDINLQFDTNISINDIYEHNTLGKLVNTITSNRNEQQRSNLIQFPEHPGCKAQATKSRPLFMVHGLGGHLASFYPLVKNLKDQLLKQHQLDISVYGLEANGFKEGQECFPTAEKMVQAYVALIRETQPEGPYLIGGWSYGVSIAYHIVQELIVQGEEVEVFISIDAEAPKVPKDFEQFLSEHKVSELDDLYQDETLSLLLGNFGQRFGFMHNQEECAKQQFYRFLGYSTGDSDTQIERYSKVAISNLFNARGFKPKKIKPLTTLLVRASTSNFDNYEDDWYELLESHTVLSLTLKGDHWSIMEDQALAEQLAKVVASSTGKASA